MTLRWRVLTAVLVSSVLSVRCQEAPTSGGEARDPEKAAVIEFWRHFEKATRLRLAGEIEPAAITYTEALSLNPEHEDSLYYLGQCQHELGRYLESVETYERLLAINPRSARGHSALGATLSSPDERAPLDLEKAEIHFRRAHEINLEETGPIIRLGEVLLAQGKTTEAGEWLEDAVRTNPRSVEAAFLAGYVRWKRGSPTEAEGFLNKAILACRPEAPVGGVLGEGDRRPRSSDDRKAGPALPSMMGTTLFGGLSRAFCRHLDAASPPALSSSRLEQAFTPVDAFLGTIGHRQSSPSLQDGAGGS